MVDYLDALYRYAMVLTGNPREAESLVEEVCVFGKVSTKTLNFGENLRIGLLTMLRNNWFGRLRRRVTVSRTFQVDASEHATATPAETMESLRARFRRMSECERVREAIQQLPAICREVLLLREYEELSYQEIATFLGCSVDEVLSHLVRARYKLRTLLTLPSQDSSRDAVAPSASVVLPVGPTPRIGPEAAFTTPGS